MVSTNPTEQDLLPVQLVIGHKLVRPESTIVGVKLLDCDVKVSCSLLKELLATNCVTSPKRRLRAMKRPATGMINIDSATNQTVMRGTISRISNHMTSHRRNVVIAADAVTRRQVISLEWCMHSFNRRLLMLSFGILTCQTLQAIMC